jgi:hypothetical protein
MPQIQKTYTCGFVYCILYTCQENNGEISIHAATLAVENEAYPMLTSCG